MKYKIGDKVKIKSFDWYNQNKDMNGNVTCGCEQIFNPCTARHCGQVLTIKHINSLGWYEVEEEAVFVHDEMIEGLVVDTITINEPLLKPVNISLEKEMEWNLPKGYQFVDENGNVINTTKIVLEKKIKYPKTYEECCKVIGINRHDVEIDLPQPYQQKMFNLFKLLICCDAYWKIAGEEMGLGKPWEPDYIEESWEQGCPIKYVIYYTGTHITKERKSTPSYILSFPTPEMRDAFYENFKSEIESCKELL